MKIRPDEVFAELEPALSEKKALIEASRCYYCYDAPCIAACPTGIDIPSFIRKISNGNTKGAAVDILSANIMGGTCARACPVETLCQQACVREKSEHEPVAIGRLQRYATDDFFRRLDHAAGTRSVAVDRAPTARSISDDGVPAARVLTDDEPFVRAAKLGVNIAVVGAGPAGLSCAHRLARFGYDVTIFEARPKSGGLNEYGLAPYKMAGNFAQREVDFILSIGGIEILHGQALGKEITLDGLRSKYAAVFLAMGLGGTNGLGIPGEELTGVLDAARQIEKIRQAKDLSKLSIGRNVVVIGGGNTAVDISIQMKRLGSEFVTLVYRRGEEHMGATAHERELARKSGVLIKTWARPSKLVGNADGQVSAVDFEYTELKSDGIERAPTARSLYLGAPCGLAWSFIKIAGTGRTLTLKADQVFKAIGQTLIVDHLTNGKTSVDVSGGKIVADENFQTSVPGVYAGGDCIRAGEDLTVTAVQHGKLAALAIHKKLGER